MLTTPPADRSKIILLNLDRIATETSLVVRKPSRFNPGAFMHSLLGAVISGNATFNQIVGDLKDRGVAPMPRQSMHWRIGATSTAFLMKVLSELTLQRFEPVSDALKDGRIRRILIEDASAQVMPKANAEDFPAHGNRHGATAEVKIELAYNFLTGEVLSHSLHLSTEQDKDIGKDLIGRPFPAIWCCTTWGSISALPSLPMSKWSVPSG